MKIFFWIVRLLPLAAVLLFFHYYLPSHDVVRIVDTDVKRMDVVSKETIQEGDGANFALTRDVRFINTLWPDDGVRVYRNEETNWGFPWYFKFDSGNLQTEAQDLRSTKQNPIWVVVTHYGWRIEVLSMFPNAVGLERVEGPDHFPVPWFRIVFFVLLAGLWAYLWWLWRWFVEVRWKPFLGELALDDRFENASNSVGQIWRWIKASLAERLGVGRRT